MFVMVEGGVLDKLPVVSEAPKDNRTVQPSCREPAITNHAAATDGPVMRNELLRELKLFFHGGSSAASP